MKSKILSLFTLFLLLWGGVLSAQESEQVITVKTAKNVGESVRLKVVSAGGSAVSVTGLSESVLKQDWAEYTLENNTLVITGPVKYLAVFKNKVTELSFQNASYLDRIDCEENELEKLDLSTAPNLTMLFCHKNKLKELDLSPSSMLTWVNCSENKIAKINLQGLASLKNFVCSNNPLGSIDLSTASRLSSLECANCNFSTLDLSKNSALKGVNCSYNQLTSLNLDGCASLQSLSCENNRLETIDILSLPSLTFLRAYKNQLTSLDFSNAKNIHTIYIESNKIDAEGMATLVRSLPTGQLDSKQKPATIAVLDQTDPNEANVCTKESAREAKGKQWEVVAFTGRKYEEYAGSGSDPTTATPYISFVSNQEKVKVLARYDGELKITGATGTLKSGEEGTLTLTGGPVKLEGDIYAFTASQQEITEADVNNAVGLTSLDLSLNKLSTLNIDQLKDLRQLRIEYNQLRTLDVSKNVNLTHIWCYSNKIPKLDLSNLKDLWLLTCFANELTQLDISPCPKLTKLSCDNNPLQSMDFTQNPELENIWCASTQMTSIDVSKNTKLKQFICNNNALTQLDLSQNPNINLLFCAKNKLSELDITGKPGLKSLWIFSNKIAKEAMQKIVDALPSCEAEEGVQFIVINTKSPIEANVCTTEQVAIAKGKNWRVIDLNSAEEDPSEAIDYAGSNKAELVVDEQLSLYQANGWLYVEGLEDSATLRLVTLNGENVMLASANSEGVAKMLVDFLPQGVYLLLLNDAKIIKVAIQ